MKINNYQLVYDPEGLDEEVEISYNELDIPFGDRIVFDGDRVVQKHTFDLFLKDNEIKDVIGMIKGSRLIYIDYKEFLGWFYITNYTLTWVKNMDGYKIASYSIEGYYLGQVYLKLGHFSNGSVRDYDLSHPEVVSLHSTYCTKISDTTPTTTEGSINQYLNPTSAIYFKGNSSLMKDGLITCKKGTTPIYQHELFGQDWTIDNQLKKLVIKYNDANKIFEFKNSAGTLITTISDNLNYLVDGDVQLKYGPFRSNIKGNHSNVICKAHQPYIEFEKTPSPLIFDTKRFAISIKPSINVGTLTPTTSNPQTIILDRSIGGTVPTTLQNQNSPGFLFTDYNDTNPYYLFSDCMQTMYTNGFYPNTSRNFLGNSVNSTIKYSPVADWSTGGMSLQTDGASYYGLANYYYSSTNGNYVEVTINMPYTGYYDIYLMCMNGVATGSLDFFIDTVSKGTFNMATSYHYAQYLYLGNYSLASGNRVFKVQNSSSATHLGLWYMLLVPTHDTGDVSGFCDRDIRMALNDTNVGYEVD